MTGFFVSLRMTRTRNAWNDEDAVLYFDTKEQIRKALHIHNTKPTSVLSSASNPIDEAI